MDDLVKSRGVIKGKLTRLKTFVETTENISDIQAEIRLERLNDVMREFEKVQSAIEILINDTLEIGRENEEREKFEDEYFRIKTRLMEVSRKNKKSDTNYNRDVDSQNGKFRGNSSDVKLPRIHLPTFDGSYSRWTEFFSLFNALIHCNESIPATQKLYYLKGALKEEAGKLISNIIISEKNYLVAYELLKNRYENKRKIVRSHLKELFDILLSERRGTSFLRQIVDTVREKLEVLKVMGLPTEQWSALLCYLILEKLDKFIRHDFEMRNEGTELIELNAVLKYLELHASVTENTLPGKSVGIVQKQVKMCHMVENATDSQREICGMCNNQHSLVDSYDAMQDKQSKMCHVVKSAGESHEKKCIMCNGQHSVVVCSEFKALNVDERMKNVREWRRENEFDRNKTETQESSSESIEQKNSTDLKVSLATSLNETCVAKLMPTVILGVRNKHGEMCLCRALLDNCSEESFITEETVRRLCLPRSFSSVTVGGVGGQTSRTRGIVRLVLKSRKGDFSTSTNALVVQSVTRGGLPTISVQQPMPEFGVELADGEWWKSRKIDILLGLEIVAQAFAEGVIKCDNLIAQSTKFGYTVTGVISRDSECHRENKIVTSQCTTVELDQIMKKFWEIENPKEISPLTEEESKCEEFYCKTTIRRNDGRYVVRLPFKNQKPDLGESMRIAERRCESLNRNLRGSQTLERACMEFLDEYERLEHMDEIQQMPNLNYFIPYFPVVRPASLTTKVRIVFDASCKTTNGRSLNQEMLTGPKMLTDLRSVIMRFRLGSIALSADIEKMYRQIVVDERDQKYQCIVRKQSEGNLKMYKLKTVTYGTAAAPYLAMRTLLKLAEDECKIYPQAAKIISKQFYMDDLLVSVNEENEAELLKRELIEMFASAKMNLRKWRSNVKTVSETNSDVISVGDDEIKALGLWWNTVEDVFSYCVNRDVAKKVTKRSVLSEIARLYDPLNWVAPVLVRSKIIMQKLWLCQVDWDEELSDALQNVWSAFASDIQKLNTIKVPRFIGVRDSNNYKLHGFCDASQEAYGAAVYLIASNNEEMSSHLVCARSRVAPLKLISISRLELCGAHLLAGLLIEVGECLGIKKEEMFAWCDSKNVLAWLSSHPSKWKPFVANRVAFIQDHIQSSHWRYVKGSNNPADIVSRGATVNELKNSDLWWRGPVWLVNKNSVEKENNSGVKFDTIEEVKGSLKVAMYNAVEDDIVCRFSSFIKLKRCVAYLRRFVKNCRTTKKERMEGEVSAKELREVEMVLIRVVQKEAFRDEIAILKRKNNIKLAKLVCLDPFIDEHGILRVGGRLKNASIPFSQKHPIILPKKHAFSEMLISYYHVKHFHCGTTLLRAVLGEQYWIINARSVIKKIIHRCTICLRFRGKLPVQLMGQLPSFRVTSRKRAFEIVGVDYAGPIKIRRLGQRSRVLVPCHVALFVCMSVKAIHLEVVLDETTDSFIAAYRRFVAERGVPNQIYSDNARNFVGAQRHLAKLYQTVEKGVEHDAVNNGTKWSYIPPRSPHFGGIWEANIKSMKAHLYRATGGHTLTYDTFSTLIKQIQACLNSRPLCVLPEDAPEPLYLTPGHFLTGTSLLTVPSVNATTPGENILRRWQVVQDMLQSFWVKWSKDYLNSLQGRSKWKRVADNIKCGDVVLLVDELRPPGQWSLGRIIEVHPGTDNQVRVVTVKTSVGVYKRSIRKIVKLFSNC